jgi:hypothetical protein
MEQNDSLYCGTINERQSFCDMRTMYPSTHVLHVVVLSLCTSNLKSLTFSSMRGRIVELLRVRTIMLN